MSDGGWVPTVALGTGTTFFDRGDDVAKAVVQAVKAGYRLIDTAVLYKTEEGVGKGIKAVLDDGSVKRQDLFITSKLLPFDLAKDKVFLASDTSSIHNTNAEKVSPFINCRSWK